ncbi:MAG: YeeE/YedE thiosulfate transporter family protein [Desulfococcaceae bacterium]
MRIRFFAILFIVLWAGLGAEAADLEGVGLRSADLGTPANEAAGFPGFPTAASWHPYAVGVAIGMLSWLAFFLSNHPIGVSTAVAKTAGMMERAFRGAEVEKRPYYQKIGLDIGWEWVFVAGIVPGALLSAVTSGQFEATMTPEMWSSAFGDVGSLRWLTAFLGGMIMMIGARWAGGCTSGHGISGTLQLVVSGWVAMFSFFAGGVITAFLLYAGA